MFTRLHVTMCPILDVELSSVHPLCVLSCGGLDGGSVASISYVSTPEFTLQFS